MGRIVISVVLGSLSVFVFAMGSGPFAVRGQNSVQESLAGSIAVALYLAVCQFSIARYNGCGVRTNIAEIGRIDTEAISLGQYSGSRISALLFDWPILIAMVAPLLAMFLLMVSDEKGGTVLAQGVPMLVAGCIGGLTGALLANRVSPRAHTTKSQTAWRAILRVGAALLLIVAAILVVVVIPAAAKDTSRHTTPGSAGTGYIVIVVLHGLLAVPMLKCQRRNRTPAFLPVLPTAVTAASAGTR